MGGDKERVRRGMGRDVAQPAPCVAPPHKFRATPPVGPHPGAGDEHVPGGTRDAPHGGSPHIKHTSLPSANERTGGAPQSQTEVRTPKAAGLRSATAAAGGPWDQPDKGVLIQCATLLRHQGRQQPGVKASMALSKLLVSSGPGLTQPEMA